MYRRGRQKPKPLLEVNALPFEDNDEEDNAEEGLPDQKKTNQPPVVEGAKDTTGKKL